MIFISIISLIFVLSIGIIYLIKQIKEIRPNSKQDNETIISIFDNDLTKKIDDLSLKIELDNVKMTSMIQDYEREKFEESSTLSNLLDKFEEMTTEIDILTRTNRQIIERVSAYVNYIEGDELFNSMMNMLKSPAIETLVSKLRTLLDELREIISESDNLIATKLEELENKTKETKETIN